MAPVFDSRFRGLALASAALVVVLVWAGAASAAPVVRSANLSLTLAIQGLGLPGIVITGNGFITVDTTAGTISISPGLIAQTAPITIPVTATTALASLRATGLANMSGVFSLGGGAVTSPSGELPCATPVPVGIGCVTAGAGNLGGQMLLYGTMFMNILPHTFVSIPLALPAMGIGRGGFARIPNTPAGHLFEAAPWTQGVAKVGYTGTSKTTWMGQFQGNPLTVTYTMSWITTATTAGAGGTVNTPNSGTITLVSPTYLNVFGNAHPVFSTLQIHFVPEPGTAVLLVAGLAGFAAARRRRSLPYQGAEKLIWAGWRAPWIIGTPRENPGPRSKMR